MLKSYERNPIDDIIIPLHQEIFGRPLFLSPPQRGRILVFIEELNLSLEELENFYRYVLEYYKDKGYYVRPGHLCSRRIKSFVELVKGGPAKIINYKLYYHPLYRRRPASLSPPYEETLFKYLKFARHIMEASRLIYVPKAGLVMETGFVFYKQAVAETSHFRDSFREYSEAFSYFLSLADKFRHRDTSRIWRSKPFWKILIPREYFNSLIGSLTYEEALLFVDMARFMNLTKREMSAVSALSSKLERFREQYGEYLWLLPKPRTRIVRVINSLCRHR